MRRNGQIGEISVGGGGVESARLIDGLDGGKVSRRAQIFQPWAATFFQAKLPWVEEWMWGLHSKGDLENFARSLAKRKRGGMLLAHSNGACN